MSLSSKPNRVPARDKKDVEKDIMKNAKNNTKKDVKMGVPKESKAPRVNRSQNWKRPPAEAKKQEQVPWDPTQNNPIRGRQNSLGTPIWEEGEVDLSHGYRGTVGEDWPKYDKSSGAAPDDDIDVWSHPAGFDNKRPDV